MGCGAVGGLREEETYRWMVSLRGVCGGRGKPASPPSSGGWVGPAICFACGWVRREGGLGLLCRCACGMCVVVLGGGVGRRHACRGAGALASER